MDEHGNALTGSALEAAKRDPYARRCGHFVRLRAKFCGKCGSVAPNAWWRCGSCGKWIGAETETCPHCGHRQDLSARMGWDSGVWRKGDDVFAQRFDLGDLSGLLSRGIVVQEGQCAILLSNGKVSDVLPPGSYSAGELGDLKSYAESGARKSLVMVDMGEMSFPIMMSGLRSKDDLDLNLGCRVLVQFDPQQVDLFASNVLSRPEWGIIGDSARSSVGYDAIAKNLLLSEVELGARDFCNQHRIDELFKDAELRTELEDRISRQLRGSMKSAGMLFVRLGEVDFHGGVFERLREESGEVEVKRRHLEYELRLQELQTDAEKRKALGADQLDDYLEQLALEKDMKDILRADEIAKVHEAFDRDRALAEQSRTHGLEVSDAEHGEALKRIQQEGELARRQAEHSEVLRQRLEEQRASVEYEQIEVQIQTMQQEAALALAGKKLDLKEKELRQDEAHDERRAKILEGKDFLTRLSLAKSNQERYFLKKAYEAQLRSGMDPLQLLADAAAQGDAGAGEALKNMSADKTALLEQWRAEQQAMYREQLDRIERMHEKSVEALAKAAEAGKNSTTQVIK